MFAKLKKVQPTMLLQKLKIDLLGKKNKNTLLTLKRGNKIFCFLAQLNFLGFHIVILVYLVWRIV